mgnify:FL=1|tara:strand:+ start:3725 stop:3973 length:249 start_codon:yes stop_codon:yes gene_type:complete
MRVFATELKESGDIVLIEWKSIKSFEASESWIDSRFINVCTTDDIKVNFQWPRSESHEMVILTENQERSHQIMHEKSEELRA